MKSSRRSCFSDLLAMLCLLALLPLATGEPAFFEPEPVFAEPQLRGLGENKWLKDISTSTKNYFKKVP